MRILFLFFGLLLLSCDPSDAEIIQKNRESTLHDNSSKIWVINRVLKKGVNYSKPNFQDKDVAIFFEGGKVLFQPMNTLGFTPQRYGELILYEGDKSVTIDFQDEKWQFMIISMSSKKIFLKHESFSDFKYDLELISYPDRQENSN